MIDTPINENLAHQDAWHDFNPHGINQNQNAYNQITFNSSLNGDLNQTDFALDALPDCSWLRYITESNMNNAEYI